MNGLTYLRAAIFPVKTSFSRLPHFLSHIREQFIHLPFEYEAVRQSLDEIIASRNTELGIVSRDDILRILLAEDLHLIRTSLDVNRQVIENDSNFSRSLSKCRDESVALLRGLGLSITSPEIYIVDSFPHPYERATFAAMSPDAWDEKLYGIPKGIYFLDDALCPIYSRFMLVHEIIHSVLGESSPEYMGRGLEEGLAEIVGALYLGSHILGKETTQNTFYHNRLGYGIDQFWQLYLDYARMAAYIYYTFGLDGLVAMLKRGRKTIKEVEALCFQQKYGDVKLPSGTWVPDLTDLVSFVTMTFSRDFVVSPVAFYLSRFIQEGSSVKQIAEIANLDTELVSDAVKELQDRVFVLLESNGRIDISDAQLLLHAGGMRYEIGRMG